ncbi:hypothetical protein JHK86_016411 [Glycine max]|nr:hypothetical protein JHK86_016411 [Glycine max]
MSSWLGTSILTLAEWFYKKMPLVSYLYVVSKQISAAISPDQSSNAFKEVAISIPVLMNCSGVALQSFKRQRAQSKLE